LKSRTAKHLPLHRRYQGLTCRDQKKIEKYRKRLTFLMKALILSRSENLKARYRRLIHICAGCYIRVKLVTKFEGTKLVRKNHRFESFEEWQLPNFFRFKSAHDLHRLKACLNIEDDIVVGNGYHVNGEEYLLLGLYRMSYPRRLSDVEEFFGIEYTLCSRIFRHFLEFMCQNWGRLLEDNLEYWKPFFASCANSVHQKLEVDYHIEVPGCNVFAFIDNTLYTCCRPGGEDYLLQEAFYTGWKKIHGLKFQTIDLPNGMTAHSFGPMSVRHNDSHSLIASDINAKLALLQAHDVIQYILFGDSAYHMLSHIMSKLSPPADDPIPPFMAQINEGLGACRVSIEWGYKDLKTFWAYLGMKAGAKIKLRTPGKQFLVGLILKNMYTACYGNQTSSYFDLLPPTLEHYTGFNPVPEVAENV
jgi:hypothetical protein